MDRLGKTTQFCLALVALCSSAITNHAESRASADTSKGLSDVVFGDGFEGSWPLAGQISGKVLYDPDRDGNLNDGEGRGGVSVYLDANYNGRLDDGERTVATGVDGAYVISSVPSGIHHVRQELAPPSTQTFPEGGQVPALDGLPDEVHSYVHAAPGVGQFDVPYGRNASAWPAEWDNFYFGPMPLEIDSPDLVLKPIGIRSKMGASPFYGTEFITLPTGAALTVRFDEAVIDGEGPDLLVYSLSRGSAGEEVEIKVGQTDSSLTSLGIFSQDEPVNAIDLAAFAIPGPIHFVEFTGQDVGGSWWGFELVGVEAVHFATPDPGAHIVVVTPQDLVHEDKDFGRYAQDLPPTVTVAVSDNEPATPGLRAGESMTLQIAATDDVGVAEAGLTVNGQSVSLDTAQAAVVELVNPGEVFIQVSATDTAGQVSQRDARYYVLNADGSNPVDPNLLGQTEATDDTAPTARILSPSPGANLSDDVDVVATITGSPEPTAWTLEYAPVDAVNPNDLAADDPDYIQIANGSGSVVSSPIGTLALSSLADGIYFVRLTAQNGSGQSGYFGQVLAKNVDEAVLRPQVIIDAPQSGSQVTMIADITGTITSTRPLLEWFVEYAKADQVDLNNLGSQAPDWKRIAAGDQTVEVSDTLAVLDATLIRNDSYVVRVVARNDIGLGWVEPLLLEVTGEAKLGRNRLEFRDLLVEVGDFPLQLVRVYDSLEADRNGELGFGWSLQLQDTNIGETVPDTGVLGLFGSTPFRVGTRVYITAPTGERLGFTFEPEAGANTLFGTAWRAVFTPDPGNYHQLAVPEGDQEFLQVKDDGNVFLIFVGLPYNPEKYVLTTPDGIRYTAHEDRGLLGAEDLNGNVLTINTDSIRHSAGPELTLVRDAQGRITEIRDPENNVWRYEYDGAGDLVGSIDPDLFETTYRYSATYPHYLEEIVDPQGRRPQRFEYDPDDGRLIAVIDENGNRRESSVDPEGFTGTSTDGRGYVTYYEYDARGNVTLIEDHELNVTTFAYEDPANPDRETELIDSNGEQWTYEYNDMGLPTRLVTPLSSFGNVRFESDYDEFGNVTRYKDPEARVSTYTFDSQGNRLTENPFDGVSSELSYGPSGQLTNRKISDSFAVSYTYDSNGFLATQTDPTGLDLTFVNLQTGLPIQRTDNAGSLDISFTPGGLLNTQEDENGNIATLVKNADGSLTRTDRNGNETTIIYDAEERPVEISLPEGGRLLTTYDADGNPAVVTDPLNNTVTYTFDHADQLTSIEDHLGNSESYTRDAFGNVVEIVDRNGKRRTFVWDANRGMTHERWHDGGGAVVREMVFTYNALRGLEQIDDTVGSDTYTLSYSGRLPRLGHIDYILPGQEPWRVRYDWSVEEESPTQLQVGMGFSTLASIRAESYSGQTLRLEWNHPGPSGNGNELQIYRNPVGTIERIQRLTGNDGGDAISVTRYTYDSQSRVTGIRHEDEFGGLLHPNADHTYTRDPEGRLTSESGPANVITYSHDGDGQLMTADNSDAAYSDESYTYDLAGNRITSHLAPGAATVVAPNRITAAGDFSYEYDNAGNVVRRTHAGTGEVTEFEYDHRNRLTRGTTHPSLGAPADHTWEFEYDYLDRMLFRVVDGVKTWVLHERQQPIAEFADGSDELSAFFLYDPATLDAIHAVWRADATGERWFLRDQLGSVRGITDSAFTVLNWIDYDSFGNLQPGSSLLTGESIGFASRDYVPELDLYHHRRRFFDPVLGRFTQEDPTKYAGRDYNLYRYALNDPTGFVDPTGEVAFINEAELVNFLLGIAKTITTPDDLVFPCHIAGWSASNFAYFDPLAAIILNPMSARNSPTIERENLKELTGCNTK